MSKKSSQELECLSENVFTRGFQQMSQKAADVLELYSEMIETKKTSLRASELQVAEVEKHYESLISNLRDKLAFEKAEMEKLNNVFQSLTTQPPAIDVYTVANGTEQIEGPEEA